MGVEMCLSNFIFAILFLIYGVRGAMWFLIASIASEPVPFSKDSGKEFRQIVAWICVALFFKYYGY